MARHRSMPWYPMPSGSDDGTKVELDSMRSDPRNLTSKTGNMAKDGYTVIARRPRWAEPGNIMDNADAQRADEYHSYLETFED